MAMLWEMVIVSRKRTAPLPSSDPPVQINGPSTRKTAALLTDMDAEPCEQSG